MVAVSAQTTARPVSRIIFMGKSPRHAARGSHCSTEKRETTSVSLVRGEVGTLRYPEPSLGAGRAFADRARGGTTAVRLCIFHVMGESSNQSQMTIMSDAELRPIGSSASSGLKNLCTLAWCRAIAAGLFPRGWGKAPALRPADQARRSLLRTPRP